MMLAVSGQLDDAVYYFSIDAKIPSDILSELHVLDNELGKEIAQLHYHLAKFNDFISLNVTRLRGFDGKQRGEFSTKFTTYLNAVDTLSNNAWALLQRARGQFES
jgi:hypothetical protein